MALKFDNSALKEVCTFGGRQPNNERVKIAFSNELESTITESLKRLGIVFSYIDDLRDFVKANVSRTSIAENSFEYRLMYKNLCEVNFLLASTREETYSFISNLGNQEHWLILEVNKK